MAEIDRVAAASRLEARRSELKDLAKSTVESRQPVELDQTRVGRLSRMDALQGQAMSLETARRRAEELRRIDAALERIEEGEYGYCLTCGEPIDARRLDLDPTLATCVDCARIGEGR